MKKIVKYTVEEFMKKFTGRTHISAGIHYDDGSMESVFNCSFPYIKYLLTSGKTVSYIACCN